jgi:hypothetical protein
MPCFWVRDVPGVSPPFRGFLRCTRLRVPLLIFSTGTPYIFFYPGEWGLHIFPIFSLRVRGSPRF